MPCGRRKLAFISACPAGGGSSRTRSFSPVPCRRGRLCNHSRGTTGRSTSTCTSFRRNRRFTCSRPFRCRRSHRRRVHCCVKPWLVFVSCRRGSHRRRATIRLRLPVEHSALHHQPHFPQRLDVARRVALHGDEVGEQAPL